MESARIYGIMREIIAGFSVHDPSFQGLPETLSENTLLNDLGLDITTLPEVIAELKKRLGGKDLGLDSLNPSDFNALTKVSS